MLQSVLLISLATLAAQPADPAAQQAQPATSSPAPDSTSTPSAQPTTSSEVPPDNNPFDLIPPRRWTVRAEPAYWYAAPRGDLSLPTTIGDVTLGDSVFAIDSDVDLSTLDADDPASAGMGRVHVSSGLWRLTFAGAALSTDGDATAPFDGRVGDAFFAQGDDLDTEFEFWAFEASVSYAIFHGPQPGDPGDPTRLRYMLEILAGARVEGVDFSLDVTPGLGARPPELGLSESESQVFAQPIAGVRLTLDLFEDVTIEVGGSVGYFTWSDIQTSSTWDVMAAISWRPVAHLGIQFGYRFLGLSGSTDESDGEAFEYRGSSAGLFAGLVLQF